MVGEEKRRRRREEGRRKKEEGRKTEKQRYGMFGTFVWICKGFLYEFVYGILYEIVRILYGYLFGGFEYLFLCRILVCNSCLVWLWSSMEEKIL